MELIEAAYSMAQNHPLKSVNTDFMFLKSSRPICDETSDTNLVRWATAGEGTSDCNPALKNSHPSLLKLQHDTKVINIQECCDVIIGNWTSFSTGTAIADVPNGRWECRVSIHRYGFLLIPALRTRDGVPQAQFTVYAFKRFFDTTHEVPIECVKNLASYLR